MTEKRMSELIIADGGGGGSGRLGVGGGALAAWRMSTPMAMARKPEKKTASARGLPSTSFYPSPIRESRYHRSMGAEPWARLAFRPCAGRFREHRSGFLARPKQSR